MVRRRYRRRRDFAQLELPLESNRSAGTSAKSSSPAINNPIFAQVWFNTPSLAKVAAEAERTSALEQQVVTVEYYTHPQDPRRVVTHLEVRRHDGPRPRAGVGPNTGSPGTDKPSDFLNSWVPLDAAGSSSH